MEKNFFVCILANRTKGTLYVGLTSDLPRRMMEHREGTIPGFTDRYGIKRLVHYEVYDTAENAIIREKRLKKWNRDWKVRLIEEQNPDWSDLWERLNE